MLLPLLLLLHRRRWYSPCEAAYLIPFSFFFFFLIFLIFLACNPVLFTCPFAEINKFAPFRTEWPKLILFPLCLFFADWTFDLHRNKIPNTNISILNNVTILHPT